MLFSVTDGIVPIESVLARIEVKSKLTASELKDAVLGAMQFKALGMAIDDLTDAEELRCLFAFGTDLANGGKTEMVRLREAFEAHNVDSKEPPIVALCVVGRGCWLHSSKTDGSPYWAYCPADAEFSEVLTFVGVLLNSFPNLRAKRRSARLGSYVVDMSKVTDAV